jgi:cell division protein FtsL
VNKSLRNNIYKQFSRVMVSALTGQAKIGVTIVVYSTIALLLLTYVSAQIYAGVLMQEIAELKQARCDLREDANKLTGDYVSLSSRSRVSQYCEKRLGMIEAVAGESFEILAVGNSHDEFATPMELTRKQAVIPKSYGYSLKTDGERPAQ